MPCAPYNALQNHCCELDSLSGVTNLVPLWMSLDSKRGWSSSALFLHSFGQSTTEPLFFPMKIHQKPRGSMDFHGFSMGFSWDFPMGFSTNQTSGSFHGDFPRCSCWVLRLRSLSCHPSKSSAKRSRSKARMDEGGEVVL